MSYPFKLNVLYFATYSIIQCNTKLKIILAHLGLAVSTSLAQHKMIKISDYLVSIKREIETR